MTEPHVIQQQIVELLADRQGTAERGQSMVHRAWDDRYLPVIDRAFGQACPEDDTIVIERLEFDLGVLPLDDFEDLFAERLERLLRERLAEQIDRQASGAGPVLGEAQRLGAQPPRVLYFLREGRLPWWSPETTLETLGRELDELIATAPEVLGRWLLGTGPDPRIARRLVEQFGAARAAASTVLIARDLTAVVKELAAVLEQADLPAAWIGSALPPLLWESAWQALRGDIGLAAQASRVSDTVLARIGGDLPKPRHERLDRAMAEAVSGLTGGPPGPVDRDGPRGAMHGRPEAAGPRAERQAKPASSQDAKGLARSLPGRPVSGPDAAPDGAAGTDRPRHAAAPEDRAEPTGSESHATEIKDPVREPPDDAVEHGRAPKLATPDGGSVEPIADPRSPSRRNAQDHGSAGAMEGRPLESKGPDGQAREGRPVDSRGPDGQAREERPVDSRGPADRPREGAERDFETPGPSAEAAWPPAWRPLFDTAEESAATPVGNAGLVLLWPFLGRLFQALDYVERGKWLSDEAPIRAVHLLQFLATGESGTPEYLLVLNKLLCGLPVYEPVPYELVLDERERDEGVALLRAAIGHWSALKNTSVDGLRQAFLQRAGLVQPVGDNWLLQVEREAHDVLLEKLPWGFSMVRLSWMQTTLEVRW